MVDDYEECRKKLEELISWYQPDHRNEANTRFQVIDRLFFECLGWSRDDVVMEEHYGGEYADYSFNAPRRILIVEAKREDQYFEIPTSKSKIEYSIPSLSRDNPNLKSAILQAASYCQERGAPFGAVSNGYQLIAFIAVRSDGIAPLDGKALVFSSLEKMLENFFHFWQSLSKVGIEEKNIQTRLIGDLQAQIPAKLSASIFKYPGIKSRNEFQIDLQTVSDLVIEDLARSEILEEIFLKECYCKTGALSQNSFASKTILETRYAALFDSNTPSPVLVPAVEKQGISPELLAESISRRPILIIGSVGVGKTTFIRNLIKVEAFSVFEKSITLYIDFGSKATLSMDLKSFILEEILKQLRELYEIDIEERKFVCGVYHSDLQRFRKGIYSDLYTSDPSRFKEKEIELLEKKLMYPEEHIKQSLKHLAIGRKKQLVIILDNSDQRDEHTQQQVFLISQEIAEHWSTTVFVTLRPETFHRSQQIGALSGYHPKAFSISPPRVDLVLEKRLSFALKLTRGEISIPSLPEGIGVRLSSLELIICSFLKSLKVNNELSECIDNVSGGNIRLALDLVRGFFGSGHVDTHKIVRLQSESENYTVPLHEFLKAVICGDNSYYDSSRSPIANIFDICSNDAKEHFLIPLLIGAIHTLGSSGSNEGFIETSVIYEHLQGVGFTADQIDRALVISIRKKMIDTATRQIPQLGQKMPHTLRITALGLYHINQLCCLFSYIDAVVIDTPILDNDVKELIHDVINLEDRLDRAESFRRYLDIQWSKNNMHGLGFEWPNLSSTLKRKISNIRGYIAVPTQMK
jgi:predicted type IV restriction endonuclease